MGRGGPGEEGNTILAMCGLGSKASIQGQGSGQIGGLKFGAPRVGLISTLVGPQLSPVSGSKGLPLALIAALTGCQRALCSARRAGTEARSMGRWATRAWLG